MCCAPGGGHSHISVDIKCLSIDAFFTAILHPVIPFFSSVHTQRPYVFFTFVSNFYIQNANFSALRAHFEKFTNLAVILTYNLQISTWNWSLYAQWFPLFGFHIKRDHIFEANTKWPPFFQKNLTPNASYFRSPVGTCTSLSYSSARVAPVATHGRAVALFPFV